GGSRASSMSSVLEAQRRRKSIRGSKPRNPFSFVRFKRRVNLRRGPTAVYRFLSETLKSSNYPCFTHSPLHELALNGTWRIATPTRRTISAQLRTLPKPRAESRLKI